MYIYIRYELTLENNIVRLLLAETSIYAVYKLISRLARPHKRRRGQAQSKSWFRVTNRIESARAHYRPTAAHNRIIQILTAAFYGSPPVFLVPPIFIANHTRRSITQHGLVCRGSDVIAEEDALFSTRRAPRVAGKSLISVRMFAPSIWFYERWSATKSPCKYMRDTLLPRDAVLPIPAIFHSLDRIFLLARWSSQICMYAFRSSSSEKKMYHEARYIWNTGQACAARSKVEIWIYPL